LLQSDRRNRRRHGQEKRKNDFSALSSTHIGKQILAHAKENGIGQKYLIQHSAGSGKPKQLLGFRISYTACLTKQARKKYF
jgi:hypothetical protein